MNYTLEDIYILVGKDDKVAGITFRDESDAFNKYASFIVVVFRYTQQEREDMDVMIQNESFFNHGQIRAKYLGTELTDEKIKSLETDGINTQDISAIISSTSSMENTFHSLKKKKLDKIEIPMHILPNGRDFDWIYGFNKHIVNIGIGLSPRERNLYFACKLYYEPDKLTDIDRQEIYNETGCLFENVEYEYLMVKAEHEDINEDETQRLYILFDIIANDRLNLLENHLIQAGSSLKKLHKTNTSQACQLFLKVMHFKERRLTVKGKYPIYIDTYSYLHIYMRHLEEFQVNKHFEHKDKFLWDEEDVFSVMEHIIREIEEEYQIYRAEKPTVKYSRYGRKSIYFQGDYYTLHIEPNGRIITFYKNKKEHEKGLSQN